MLGKLPRNEIIIKSGRAIEKNKGGGKRDATQRECCWCRQRENLFITLLWSRRGIYIRERLDIKFGGFVERDGNRPILVRTRDFFPVLLPTIIIDVHYENERLAGGQLEQSTISLCGTKSNRQGYAIHQVHSQKSEKILHYTCALVVCIIVVGLYMRAVENMGENMINIIRCACDNNMLRGWWGWIYCFGIHHDFVFYKMMLQSVPTINSPCVA